MNFETEYKTFNFHISLENSLIADVTLLFDRKFNRLPNKTKDKLKNGEIIPFNLIILSKNNLEERTHYWSNILLTSNPSELLNELGTYLDDEEILDLIIKNWGLSSQNDGPDWMHR
jgi:hypothetical protein